MTSVYEKFHELRPRIIVMGVGGAGGNAVNNMIASGLQGVEFVAANTDAQALSMSGADMRFQMGANLTEGLGAGSNPEIGEGAAEEVLEEMKELMVGAHMVFIACGMGGGTGTGAAPVIARVAQEMGVLTVAVVTKPFHFEGRRRMRVADAGIEQLRKYVDTMIVIPNQNLFRLANEQTTFADSFRLADQVLNSGVACVTDLIMKEGLINLDFADVKTVITEMGAAVMGTGMAHGEGRAKKAAEAAISNPLIDDISLAGAKGLLISISGGQDMTLFEVDEVASRIRSEVDADANIIVGATFDDQLEGHIRVSLVASGLNHAHPKSMHEEADRRRMEIDQERERQQNPNNHGLQDRLREIEDMPPPQTGGRLTPHGGRGNPPLPNPGGSGENPGGLIPEGRRVAGKGNVEIVNKPPRFITDSAEVDGETGQSGHLNQDQLDTPVRGRGFTPGAPEAVAKPMRRMPSMEDLPLTGQNQLKAYEAPPASHGVEQQKKKVGFFERLTGRGREKPADPSLREAGTLGEAGMKRGERHSADETSLPPRRGHVMDEGRHVGGPLDEVRYSEPHYHNRPQGQTAKPDAMIGEGRAVPPADPEYIEKPDPNQGDLFNKDTFGKEGYLQEPDAAHQEEGRHPQGSAQPHVKQPKERTAERAEENAKPPLSRHEQAFGAGAEHNSQIVRHDGFDEVQHRGQSTGFVSGVNANPYAPPAREENQYIPPEAEQSARQPGAPGKAPLRPADRYPTYEISKGGGVSDLGGPEDDDPIGDIPPFLRKTTQKG